MTLETKCTESSDIALLDTFGAVDFVGYTCADDGPSTPPSNCFVDVEYSVTATNIGTVGFVIVEFGFTYEGVVAFGDVVHLFVFEDDFEVRRVSGACFDESADGLWAYAFGDDKAVGVDVTDGVDEPFDRGADGQLGSDGRDGIGFDLFGAGVA